MDGPLIRFDPGFEIRWDALWPQLGVPLKERHNRIVEHDVLEKYGYDYVASVLGEKRVKTEFDSNKDDNTRKTLIRRALRRQALDIINTPGFFSSLEPIWEHVDQVKRILDIKLGHKKLCLLKTGIASGRCTLCRNTVDTPKYEVSIITALPDENHAGMAEKTSVLKRIFGPEYFSRLHSRIYVAGRKTQKGDMNWDVIFEDNTDLGARLGIASGLHMIVETDHNRGFVPGLFQKYVPLGTDWIEAAGL